MINIIETSEYQLTVYIHTVDDKKKITLKVKNISKNKYYDIIIDNEYFENKNMFDIFKENINNIEEENVSVDFDENNIEIIIDTDNCKMTFTFTLTLMSLRHFKKENELLIEMLNQSFDERIDLSKKRLDETKKLWIKQESYIKKFNELREIFINIKDNTITDLKQQVEDINSFYLIKDNYVSSIESISESEDEIPVKKSTAKKSALPTKGISGSAKKEPAKKSVIVATKKEPAKKSQTTIEISDSETSDSN
jgi:hypothetical protein